MKKVVGALVLALIAIGVCVYSLFYVKKTSEQALLYIAEIQNGIEEDDYENSKISAQNLEDFWRKQNGAFSTFVHHEILEEIDESVRCINLIIKDFDESEETDLKVACKKAQILLENFKDSEMPTIANIL